MNRMKKFLLILLLFVAFTGSYAQQTLIYTHSDRLFEQGKELFDQQKYSFLSQF